MKNLAVALTGGCLLVLLGAMPAAAQADYFLVPVGGGGGNEFQARCPAGQHLLGFNLRAGHDIDAIQPVCGIPQSATTVPATTALQSFGGNGGQPVRIICPAQTPIVLGMYVGAEGINGLLVNNIHLFCGIVAGQQLRPEYAAAHHNAPRQESTGFGVGNAPKTEARVGFCPAGLIGVGIHGASGAMLDRVGLICGAPETGFTATAGRTLGKRKLPQDDTAGRTLGRRRPGDAAATSAAAEAGGLAAKRARGIPALYPYFVGRYVLGPTHIIAITGEENRLIAEEIINGSTFDRQEIFPTSETTFVLEKDGREEVRVRFEFTFTERLDPKTPKARALYWGATRAVRMPEQP